MEEVYRLTLSAGAGWVDTGITVAVKDTADVWTAGQVEHTDDGAIKYFFCWTYFLRCAFIASPLLDEKGL